VASAISSQTAAVKENTAAALQSAQQLSQLAEAQRRFETEVRVLIERLNTLIKLEDVARLDVGDIRRALTDQGLKLTEVASAAKEARDDSREFKTMWTPPKGTPRATPEEAGVLPEGVTKRGIAFSWGGIAGGVWDAVKRHWPLAAAGGVGAAIKHLLSLLHG
jgi:hypothetical protein